MLDKAVEKIKSEMNQNKGNSYIQVVGGFLLQHLHENPEVAEKILVEGKTLGKSLDKMRETAEKKKVGNCAVLTDQEGFEIVLKYFGITGGSVKAGAPKVIIHSEREKPATKRAEFNVSLDDLL